MNALRRRVLALAPCLLLASCMTLGLWGIDTQGDGDASSDESANDETAQWSWGLFGLRLLLTPVTLALDCASIPALCASLHGGDSQWASQWAGQCGSHCGHGHR